MTRTALLLALLFPAVAHAVICKTIDADGVVSYADVPADECPQAVKLPDYSRYTPRPIERQAAPVAGAEGSEVRFERYQSMAITQPAANGTVRSNEGTVAVSITLQPALQQGHRIALTLDGLAVSGDFGSPAIQLSAVDRGTHTLRAAVRDASGKTLISSDPVRFTLRKTGLNDPANKPEPTPPIAPNPPGYNPPAGAPDYTPPSGGGYQPSPGGVSTTPGRTNPAFTPRYTP